MNLLRRNKKGAKIMTALQALELALEYMDKIEVKGHDNVFNLYKAYDAVFATKVALQQKEDKKETEKE